ncbi:hypothetical protein ACFWWA_21435 [Streptomyces goshikiensis]|uniref:hypothetical protein n=1 Tax=Streptomyces goshikiensis TaxID=1942 RepID=UPI00365DC01D
MYERFDAEVALGRPDVGTDVFLPHLVARAGLLCSVGRYPYSDVARVDSGEDERAVGHGRDHPVGPVDGLDGYVTIVNDSEGSFVDEDLG